MVWLVKDKDDPKENLFFVHVPRCGGTSLTQHFGIPRKCRKGRSCWGKFGMVYFFYRYRLLESANFPIKTWEALIALLQLLASFALFLFGSLENRRIPIAAYTLLLGSIFMFGCSTFLFTAPVIGRVTWIRRGYLILVHYVMLRFMESIDWCTGTNIKGYMMHLTAQKIVKYGYVSAERFDEVCSLAIVRNPYSRMVSVYMYNRYGPLESFPAFMKRWHHMLRYYRERREMEEYYTPCHLIPQFEFTHFEGKQLVQSVVKQEELKYLKTTDEAQKAIAAGSTVGDLPDTVRSALIGMPHTNRRDSGKKWFEYFDQETLDMTYEMYKQDFLIFGYPPSISQRPDLTAPSTAAVELEEGAEPAKRNSAFRLPFLLSASLPASPHSRSPPFDLSPAASQTVSIRMSADSHHHLRILREASSRLETVNSGLELSTLGTSHMLGVSGKAQAIVTSINTSGEGDQSPDVQTPDIQEFELSKLPASQMTPEKPLPGNSIDDSEVAVTLLQQPSEDADLQPSRLDKNL